MEEVARAAMADQGTRAAMADPGTPWAVVGNPKKNFLGRSLPGGRSGSADAMGCSGGAYCRGRALEARTLGGRSGRADARGALWKRGR